MASPGRAPNAAKRRTTANRRNSQSTQAATITTLTPNSTALVLLAAHILSMLGFSTYAALLPELRDAWSLSNSQAGVVSGMFFAGYVATVSLLTALTDRIDARWVYLAGGVLAAAASAGFGLAASGFLSAALLPGDSRRRHRGDLHAGAAPALRPHLRPLPEPLHRLLYLVLRHRHGAFLRHRRIRYAAMGLACGIPPLGGRPARRGRGGVLPPGARPPERRQAVLARRALPRARLAQGARGPRQRRLHLRLCGALPGALRLACMDGGLPRLLREPARRRELPVECGRGRRGGKPHCRTRLHRRQ